MLFRSRKRFTAPTWSVPRTSTTHRSRAPSPRTAAPSSMARAPTAGPSCTASTDLCWTDELARRIGRELPDDWRLAVADAGVNGTTAAPDCSQLGVGHRSGRRSPPRTRRPGPARRHRRNLLLRHQRPAKRLHVGAGHRRAPGCLRAAAPCRHRSVRRPGPAPAHLHEPDEQVPLGHRHVSA